MTPPNGEIDEAVLMRYLDGELPPEKRREVEAALEASTRLQRQLAIFRSMHRDLSELRLKSPGANRSVWGAVNRRLTRPVGWVLLTVGLLAWFTHGVYLYLSSPAAPLQKLSASAVIIGVILLLATVIHDRYREWLTDPYRDVEH